MPRKSRLLFVCLFFIHIAARADDAADNIKDALTQKYKSHLLALRSPIISGTQKYDSSGKLLNGPPKSQWLLYGGISIEKLNLSSDTLSFAGPMLGFTGQKPPTPIPFGKPIHVEIHLDQPCQSLDEAEAVMKRVFFLEGDNTDRVKPQYLRTDDSTLGGPVYKSGNIKSGRATYIPEPKFSEEARKMKLQGVVFLHIVIDKTGSVTRIRLEKALGHGLDESAMEGVKSWRFNPAMRDGQPVAVGMNVEVAFNLY